MDLFVCRACVCMCVCVCIEHYEHFATSHSFHDMFAVHEVVYLKSILSSVVNIDTQLSYITASSQHCIPSTQTGHTHTHAHTHTVKINLA